MKSPLKILLGFTKHKKEIREVPEHLAEFDEFKAATQDIQNMQECYKGLLSASALTANCAYEFSQALQDMAAFWLENTSLIIDDGSGRILRRLGKVQHELHKMFDHYRAHISHTLTTPSESLLNELQNVEELKSQCDEKRKVYDYMRTHTAKGKSNTGKVDVFTAQQLKSTKEEYDDQVTFLVCRLMSLKQGQSRSLLTQTARHHTAQLQLFRKGLAALEDLEPHIKKIAEEQSIDHRLSELADESDDSGASFDFAEDNYGCDESASSENSLHTSNEKVQQFRHSTATGQSKSAPIPTYSLKKSDGFEKTQEMQLQKPLHSYALPIPGGAVNTSVTGCVNNSPVGVKTAGASGTLQTYPLKQCKSQNLGQKTASPMREGSHCNPHISISDPLIKQSYISKRQQLPEESNTRIQARPMPLPSSVESMPVLDATVASNSKKYKRHAHSGPVRGNLCSSESFIDGSSSLLSPHVEPSSKSGPVGHSPLSCPFASPKISGTLSPLSQSPPCVSQLHELPRPPVDSAKPSKPTSSIAHSAPLVDRTTKDSSASKILGPTMLIPASPLPSSPAGLVSNSLSVPSFGQKERLQWIEITEVSSPPLTPIAFPASNLTSVNSKTAGGSGQNSEHISVARALHASET
jgi:hypothetical protein